MPREGAPRAAAVTLLVALSFSSSALSSCSSDPVRAREVKDLGPENPDIPTGEFHRAGQPCLTCHTASGPAQRDFSIAGTIFFSAEKRVGVEGALVVLRDSQRQERRLRTNCVGNFYVARSEWDPAFPIRVLVSSEDAPETATMGSLISRDGSCAGCHSIPRSPDSPGHIWLVPQEPPNGYEFRACKDSSISPVLGGGESAR